MRSHNKSKFSHLCMQKCANPGLFLFISSVSRYNFNNTNRKSIDGVLGFKPRAAGWNQRAMAAALMKPFVCLIILFVKWSVYDSSPGPSGTLGKRVTTALPWTAQTFFRSINKQSLSTPPQKKINVSWEIWQNYECLKPRPINFPIFYNNFKNCF